VEAERTDSRDESVRTVVFGDLRRTPAK
jgi:hypothetical protein